MRILLLVAAFCTAVLAQNWEIGGGAGYGIYRNGTINAPAGNVTAGFRNRFAIGAWMNEDLHDHLSGGFRYVYQDGDPFLEAGGIQTNLQGQSHAYTYDLQIHFRNRAARIRPYAAIGAGVKQYVVTGPENPFQPFAQIGVLTKTDELKFVSAPGGGVALLFGSHIDLRLDFRDYITTFPKKVITPVPLATGRGIIHQFTPLAGIGYRF